MQRTNIYIHENLAKEVYYLILGLASSFSVLSFPARQVTNSNNINLNSKHCINLHHIVFSITLKSTLIKRRVKTCLHKHQFSHTRALQLEERNSCYIPSNRFCKCKRKKEKEKKTKNKGREEKRGEIVMCRAPFTCAHWNFPFSSSWHWPPLLRQFEQCGNTFTSRVIWEVNRGTRLATPTVLMFTGYWIIEQPGGGGVGGIWFEWL